MYVITGGAGFIGSNVAAALDDAGREIAIVDLFGKDDVKWRNVAKRRLVDLVKPEHCISFVQANKSNIEGIVHMGAISTTTESDIDAIVANNIRPSIDLWRLCATHGIPFVYASSAATYGDGAFGFDDGCDEQYLARLRPLNGYGWSKHVFDRFALRSARGGAPAPPHWAGLKFFNVYGPNEYHKGDQRSVASKLHEQIRAQGKAYLFKSDNPEYADGAQLRDFVWVGDCVDATLWALDPKLSQSGLYNVGSGVARSFHDMAKVIFSELGLAPQIEFIDLPENLAGKYQYYTCSSLDRLRAAGFSKQTTSLEEGLRRYVRNYLERPDRHR
ncbi:MAG: ADP-glyceromanno-heptose 6-epimerase [Methylocystis sp.]